MIYRWNLHLNSALSTVRSAESLGIDNGNPNSSAGLSALISKITSKRESGAIFLRVSSFISPGTQSVSLVLREPSLSSHHRHSTAHHSIGHLHLHYISFSSDRSSASLVPQPPPGNVVQHLPVSFVSSSACSTRSSTKELISLDISAYSS